MTLPPSRGKRDAPGVRNPVADLLQQWLDEKGWRAADIERRGGPTRQVISRWMVPGKVWTQVPDPEHITGAAAAFGKPAVLLQEALAKGLGWGIVDRTVSPEASQVIAAMSDLSERDRQTVAQMALNLAESLGGRSTADATILTLSHHGRRSVDEDVELDEVAKRSTAKSRRSRSERVAPDPS